MQGNWGNIITPAIRRPLPATLKHRLSKFALEAAFNPKTTFWTKSYDERNDEPVTLPIKFPLLLAEGVEGIAVGLSCQDSAAQFYRNSGCQHRRAERQGGHSAAGLSDRRSSPVHRLPGNGRTGRSKVRVRAKIEVRSPSLLAITEIPFGTVVPNLISSIVTAPPQKEKIKIKKVDDNTSERARIF